MSNEGGHTAGGHTAGGHTAGGHTAGGRTVAELGESGVLRRILSNLSEAEAARLGPGDDCAVLGFEGDGVVTTDSMIEGTDFRLDWHTGFELGFKLAATNLSDVAAMGAGPTALTVALACPDSTPVALLEEIARGLDAACRELAPGCGVVGGDLSRAPVLMVTVTALGEFAGRAPVTRSGARAGDTVAYAGSLGLAGLGLSLLFEHDAKVSRPSEGSTQSSPVNFAKDHDPSTPADSRAAQSAQASAAGSESGRLAPGEGDTATATACATHTGAVMASDTLTALRERHPAAITAQLAPRSPIHLGVAAADAGATAMLDVSDGLTLDAARLARASSASGAGGASGSGGASEAPGVVLDLDPDLLREGFGNQSGTEVPLDAMLFGGEDHGLLATFPAGAELPAGFLPIGVVRGRESSEATATQGPDILLGGQPCEARGWDPFKMTNSG